MSAARMQKRHPRSPVEKLLTTREEIIQFSMFLRTDPDFCMAVVKTVETIRHNEAIAAANASAERARYASMLAIVAECRRREAWPKWRKWMHKNLWLRFR